MSSSFCCSITNLPYHDMFDISPSQIESSFIILEVSSDSILSLNNKLDSIIMICLGHIIIRLL